MGVIKINVHNGFRAKQPELVIAEEAELAQQLNSKSPKTSKAGVGRTNKAVVGKASKAVVAKTSKAVVGKASKAVIGKVSKAAAKKKPKAGAHVGQRANGKARKQCMSDRTLMSPSTSSQHSLPLASSPSPLPPSGVPILEESKFQQSLTSPEYSFDTVSPDILASQTSSAEPQTLQEAGKMYPDVDPETLDAAWTLLQLRFGTWTK